MPQRLNARLTKKLKLAGNYWLFVLEFSDVFGFEAGQYVSIKVSSEGLRRSYSIASRPDGKTIELLIDVSPMGVGSKFFLASEVGQEMEALGPMGHFIIDKAMPAGRQGKLTIDNKILFVATGSGIVPFRPMVYDLLERQNFAGEVRLSWGMRYETDLFWIDEFKKLEKSHSNFKFDVVLSKPWGEWKGCAGHVEDCLKKHKESWEGWEAYLCGGQTMIKETVELLRELGMGEKEIYFEKFF